MTWHSLIDSPEKIALDLCCGSMNEGLGYGDGYGDSFGDGDAGLQCVGYGYGYLSGDGDCDCDDYSRLSGNGSSSVEWK